MPLSRSHRRSCSRPMPAAFSRWRRAPKVPLGHLVARLRAGGFRLLDTQFVTDHLRIFGAIEIPRRQYHKQLEAALIGEGDCFALPIDPPVSGAEALRHADG